jgi:hypothetical protein
MTELWIGLGLYTATLTVWTIFYERQRRRTTRQRESSSISGQDIASEKAAVIDANARELLTRQTQAFEAIA